MLSNWNFIKNLKIKKKKFPIGKVICFPVNATLITYLFIFHDNTVKKQKKKKNSTLYELNSFQAIIILVIEELPSCPSGLLSEKDLKS